MIQKAFVDESMGITQIKSGTGGLKMARQSWSYVKSMLIIVFDCEGVVHYEFAPRGQAINKEY